MWEWTIFPPLPPRGKSEKEVCPKRQLGPGGRSQAYPRGHGDCAGRPASPSGKGLGGRPLLRTTVGCRHGASGGRVEGPLQPGVHEDLRRGTPPVPVNPSARTGGGTPAHHGLVRCQDLLRCRIRKCRLIHYQLPANVRPDPDCLPGSVAAGYPIRPDPVVYRAVLRPAQEPHDSRRRSRGGSLGFVAADDR
jgi:hypothetical protein